MLDVGRLIRVSVSVTQAGAAGRTFNTLMIAGDSDVISGAERSRQFDNLNDVADAFGLTAPEYLAAALYYAQNPKPANLMIGRWIASASAGFNLGQIQTAQEQVLSNWTGITSGGFQIPVDGGALQNITGLDFSGATNLNGIASIITAALTGAVCKWTGTSFQVVSSTTGSGASAVGTLSLTGQPSSGDTFTVNGQTITFVASSPVGNQVTIGASAADSLSNLLTFLQQSTNTNIDKATYAQGTGLVIQAQAISPGTNGNSFTLAKSGTNLAVSGANLSGGAQPSSVGYAVPPLSGADISTQLGLTASTAQELVSGYSAETPVQAALALMEDSTAWYGLMFAATTPITTAQYLDVADLTEGQAITRMLGVTNQNPNTLSALVANDISSLIQSAGYKKTQSQYSSTSPYVVASMFGRMFSVDFEAQNSTIELMWKQMPGVTPEDLTDSQADALKSKNCNVYASYDNGTQLIEYGVVGSGDYIDQVWGLDWFQNAVQTACFNLLYTAPTKIPQTVPGQNQLNNAVAGACGDLPGGAVYNGLAAPGTWNSSEVFGTLQQGQYLTQGYYIFSESVDLQSEADRQARVAPPIMVALKLAGAFQEADVLVTVNP